MMEKCLNAPLSLSEDIFAKKEFRRGQKCLLYDVLSWEVFTNMKAFCFPEIASVLSVLSKLVVMHSFSYNIKVLYNCQKNNTS